MNRRNGKPICFLDFDGTLISNKYRLYYFFLNNIPQNYRGALAVEEFWNLKRMGIHEIRWINSIYHTDISVSEWDLKKKEEIESMEYLNFDQLFDFTENTLNNLKEQYHLVLISRRTNSLNLLEEIRAFKLSKYFEEIHVVAHGADVKEKAKVISMYNPTENDVMVGDTEDDFMSGLVANVKTYMVLTGIRSEWILKKYDVQDKVNVINDIRDLA